jgi:hypothetical protein
MRVQSIQDSQQQHTHYQPQQHPLTFASASSTTQAAAPLSSLLASLLQYNSKYGNAIQLPHSIISPPLPIASQLQASASYSPQQPKIESPGVFPITAAYNPSSSTSPDSSSSSLPAIFPRDTANFKDASSSSKKRRASPSSHQPVSSVVIEEGEEVSDSEAWRPTAEEYKKLSSKEKRQLRNKASARNFRLRFVFSVPTDAFNQSRWSMVLTSSSSYESLQEEGASHDTRESGERPRKAHRSDPSRAGSREDGERSLEVRVFPPLRSFQWIFPLRLLVLICSDSQVRDPEPQVRFRRSTDPTQRIVLSLLDQSASQDLLSSRSSSLRALERRQLRPLCVPRQHHLHPIVFLPLFCF